MKAQRFALAPMTMDLRIMTYALYALPIIFIGLGAVTSHTATRWILIVTAVCLIVTYAYVWLWMRPSSFEVGEDDLRIVWPTRASAVALTSIRSAQIMTRKAFKERYGWGYRVGAGGLWGGFGSFRTAGQTFTLLISRTDRFVVLDLIDTRPMMLSPEDPERFVASLTSRDDLRGGRR